MIINIPQLIQNRLHVDCLHGGFVMYEYKREVIPPIPDSMIPLDLCFKKLTLQLMT